MNAKPNLKLIEGSHVTGIGYDKKARELTVRYEGGARYRFEGIAAGKVKRILKAKSVGHAVYVEVEGKKYERVDE